MFQFPPFASLNILGITILQIAGLSRGQGLFAPNPGLSQLITSFIASVSQGIRHAPFSTFANDWTTNNKRQTTNAKLCTGQE